MNLIEKIDEYLSETKTYFAQGDTVSLANRKDNKIGIINYIDLKNKKYEVLWDGKSQVMTYSGDELELADKKKALKQKKTPKKQIPDLEIIRHKTPYEGANAGEYTQEFRTKQDAQNFAKWILNKNIKGAIVRIGFRDGLYLVYTNVYAELKDWRKTL